MGNNRETVNANKIVVKYRNFYVKLLQKNFCTNKNHIDI